MTTQERTTPVAAPSQKQLKAKILELAKRKKHIDQPGRLVAHVVNELKLTSNSTIREPITMALESLEEEGLVTIGRTGTVMNTMVYIEPKAKPAATRTPAPKTPTRQRATATAVKQPADHLPPARSRRKTAETPAPARTQPEVTVATSDAAETPVTTHQQPVIELELPVSTVDTQVTKADSEIVVDENEPEAPAEESLFARLVKKAEKLTIDLAASQQETTDTKESLSAKEQELAEADAATAQANADKAELTRQLVEARDALNESSEMNELLTADNRRLDQANRDLGETNRDLQDKVDAYQHLEARALRLLED